MFSFVFHANICWFQLLKREDFSIFMMKTEQKADRLIVKRDRTGGEGIRASLCWTVIACCSKSTQMLKYLLKP